MPVKNRIQLRRGTSTQWSNTVDILSAGELGWDTTVNNVKIGDGSNLWGDLPWLVVAGVSGQIINPATISGVDEIFFDSSLADIDQIEGQLNWNDTLGTLDLGLTDTLTTHLGQDVFYRVINLSGGTIYKGQPVYAAGVNAGGQRIEIDKFVADLSIQEVRYIGLLAETLNNGDIGYVVHFGHVRKVDLRSSNTALNPNGETWAAGDILFPDPSTAGGLTKVPPKHIIYTAIVLTDGNNGELLVRITNPGEINDLHNVNTSGVVDNNLLVWNSGSDYWEPTSSLYYVDGKLGIGTSSPSGTLHVESGGINAMIGPYNTWTNGGKLRVYGDDTDTQSQAIKAFVSRSGVGLNICLNGTSYTTGGNGLGTNIGMYGYAGNGNKNYAFYGDAGYNFFRDRVGIGNTDPDYMLDVSGSGNFTGDVSVDGHLSASTKSFLIDHPTKKGKKLQYGSLESPYHGVRLTGRDKLKEGVCIIKLPSYMKKLVREEDISIQITNYKHHKTLYVDDIDLSKNQIIIKGHRCKTLGGLEFFWSFTAIRKDVPELVVEK